MSVLVTAALIGVYACIHQDSIAVYANQIAEFILPHFPLRPAPRADVAVAR